MSKWLNPRSATGILLIAVALIALPFVAALGGPGTGDLAHRGLGRYDLQSREMRLWRGGERRTVSDQ